MSQIKLSPSKLNEFNDCPRCFYDAYTLGIKKPRGIFPSLPGGMDRVIKEHFDKYRGCVPPGIKGRIDGVLLKDQALVDKWRNWRTGMTYIDKEKDILLRGAIDDCVVGKNADPALNFYIPLDYKTKGKEPEDSGAQYYQTQLDCYNLMLNSTGYKTKEEGYLVYFYPIGVSDDPEQLHDAVIATFGISVFKIPCSIEQAKDTIRRAAELLRGKRPEVSTTCEHCMHIFRHIARKEEVK